jgi:hypothetical protein
VRQFTLPIIPPPAPRSSDSDTIGQIVANVPSGLILTPTQEIKEKSSDKSTSDVLVLKFNNYYSNIKKLSL